MPKIHFWFHHKKEQNVYKDKSLLGLGNFQADVTPVQGYHFYSNYFKIDNCYATIVTIFHTHGSDRQLVPMWGVNLLPRNLGQGVSTHLLIGMNAQRGDWIKDKLDSMDMLSDSAEGAAVAGGHHRTKLLSAYRDQDLNIINNDITDGDSYLRVDFKILIKARTLAQLDHAVGTLGRSYDQWFGKFYMHAFDGQEYEDLSNILLPADDQIGHNYLMTSSEASGMYNLVSQGINDEYGDYDGVMTGDINQSAVIWDIDNFKDHVIVAADQPARSRAGKQWPDGTRGSAMWGVKLAQDALINNHRVVHIVLNNTQVPKIGTDLSGITTNVSMNKGAINPFEMFGDRSDQLSIYPQHTEKLRLMAKQITPSLNDVDLSKYFTDIINKFYIYSKMWTPNAAHHQNMLRLVGLPHWQYPLVQDFNVYLAQYLRDAEDAGNQRKINSIERIQSSFGRMQSENGGLFNRHTSSAIDSVNTQRQVVYDFSGILRRGRNIAMAQLINAFGYAVQSLRAGDLVIIHGAEHIDGTMKDRYSAKYYVANLLENLHERDVRVAYLYDSVNKMLSDTDFNHFGSANWVLTGYMSHNLTQKYEKALKGQLLPPDLKNEVQQEDPLLYYLRRGVSNVLFQAEPTVQYNNQGTDASYKEGIRR